MGYGDHRTFETVSRVNLERASLWHPDGIEDWSPAEWGNAFAGEAGELCNVLKKILRHDHAIEQAVTDRTPADREALLEHAAQEIGDSFLYLDLVCQRLGLDMYTCIRDTFNRVSEREGFPQQLGL